ncbi:hypothetical protein Tco_0891819 [Tanacetum coccineum]|uniref:Uncharacterized protein n=1 Tax=Tanacetum coccineum TaxID=301880 RepID=A0ABQ5C747_9ASTR
MQQHDLTVLVNKLNNRIDGLEKDLQQTKKTYSTALTKLVLRVKKLEYKLKFGKARRKAKIVLSNDEEIAEDSSKQGRKISQIDKDPTMSLVSTAVPHVYTRRSVKDKGKAIMEEPATPKKTWERFQLNQLNLKELLDDPSETEYHALKNRPVSIAQARRNMITYRERIKEAYKESYFNRMKLQNSGREDKVEEEDVKPEPVLIEKKVVGIRRKTLARRRASDKKGQDSSKRQKKEKETADYEEEKDKLRMWLIVVPDEEEFIGPEILHTRFPIVDWESQSYTILVDPKQDDDIWKNQNQWKIISWKLYETCGVHTLMVDGTLMTIHMFVEKKYPFTKETLQKMLNWKLEAEAESSMAFKLLKFIKTQIEEQ